MHSVKNCDSYMYKSNISKYSVGPSSNSCASVVKQFSDVKDDNEVHTHMHMYSVQ
jgi:hypothetical protein